MFDRYDFSVKKDGTFLAGYLKGETDNRSTQVFLFTTFRIVRIVSGSADWEIGNNSYRVSAGDIIVLNNIKPRQFVDIVLKPLVYEVFAFSPAVLFSEPASLNKLYSITDFGNPVFGKDDAVLEEIDPLLDILKKNISSSHPSAAVISGLTIAVCGLLADAQTTPQSQNISYGSHTAKTIWQAVVYITENVETLKDVSDLAANFNMSRGYFTGMFSKYTGYTPMYFINRCRINRFIQLISEQKINVLDAAMQSGFDSPSGFYKTFHSICKLSPKEYLSSIENGTAKP